MPSTTYYLQEIFQTHADFLDPKKWQLYAGRISTDPHSDAASQGFIGRDFYYSSGLLSYLSSLFNNHQFTDGGWLADPTMGCQSYLMGAVNADRLIVNDVDNSNTPIVRFRTMVFDSTNNANVQLLPDVYQTQQLASLRLEASQSYGNGVYVIEALQVPHGCPAWPSFWLLGFPDPQPWVWQGEGLQGRWPTFGEIDIVEQAGVTGMDTSVTPNKERMFNATTLHTTANCTVDIGSEPNAPYAVSPKGTDCNAGGGDDGCQGRLTDPSGNADFTTGTYVAEVFIPPDGSTGGYVRTWFFPLSSSEAQSIRRATALGSSLNLQNLGPAHVRHSLSSCPGTHFQNLRMVLNTAFCGQWAGRLECSDSANTGFQGNTTVFSQCQAAMLNKWNTDPAILTNPDHEFLSPYEWQIYSIRYYSPTPQGIWGRFLMYLQKYWLFVSIVIGIGLLLMGIWLWRRPKTASRTTATSIMQPL